MYVIIRHIGKVKVVLASVYCHYAFTGVPVELLSAPIKSKATAEDKAYYIANLPAAA